MIPTGLARLPVDGDEIQETKPKWWTYICIVLGCRSLVNSSNFTYKANLHTPKVEIHTRQKLCHFGCCVAKAKLFCLKVSSRLPGLECSYGRIFIPVTEISFAKTETSVTGPARLPIWTHRNFYQGKSGGGEISETEPSRLTGLIWRGPQTLLIRHLKKFDNSFYFKIIGSVL